LSSFFGDFAGSAHARREEGKHQGIERHAFRPGARVEKEAAAMND
jgi:hypothetical protein